MPNTITVQPWPDPILDTSGHDPRSAYVETFWLPTLGPTALLLLRHLAHRLDTEPERIVLPVAETSQALGLGHRDGPSSPLRRSLDRLELFDLACSDGHDTVAVRRNVPPVNRRHIRRLPAALQELHERWVDARLAEPPVATARRRSRRLAFTLLEQGDDPDHIERVLHATGFHPSICRESTEWAYRRHREALDAANDR